VDAPSMILIIVKFLYGVQINAHFDFQINCQNLLMVTANPLRFMNLILMAWTLH